MPSFDRFQILNGSSRIRIKDKALGSHDPRNGFLARASSRHRERRISIPHPRSVEQHQIVPRSDCTVRNVHDLSPLLCNWHLPHAWCPTLFRCRCHSGSTLGGESDSYGLTQKIGCCRCLGALFRIVLAAAVNNRRAYHWLPHVPKRFALIIARFDAASHCD
jgi:hypothetical protein